MDEYNSTVEIHRSSLEAVILRIYPDYPCRPFSPGQYGSLGLISDKTNKLVKRAFSISSSIIDFDTKNIIKQKDLNYYEFYINKIPINYKGREQITPKIFRLKDGDRIFCGEKIVGQYIVPTRDKLKNILLISTHTGESPNNAIINQLLLNNSSLNISNINVGNSDWNSLYKDEHDLIQKLNKNYKFIQFYDNNMYYSELCTFISDLCNSNIKTVKEVGFNLETQSCLIMLCGDPKMIGAPIKKGNWEYDKPEFGLINILEMNSFTTTTRFKDGNIIYESYW